MKKGKREAENETDKLFMSRKKQKKHHKKKRPKVVATSSKNDESSDHDFSCDEDVPLAKKFPLNGSAAASKKDESSSSEDEDAASKKEESPGEGSTSSAEEDEESSGEGSSDESSSDNSSSAEEDVNVNIKAPAAASKKEECSDESSSDNNEPTKVKKSTDSDEVNDSDSDADKGKAIAVSEKKAESSRDNCDEEEREEAWKENETEFLIAILYAELVIHEKQLDWAGIVQKLYHQTHKQTSVTQVQTLYKKFRDETQQFMDLLQVTGYEWNPNNNKVTCKDDVWEHIYWIHGGEKVFRKRGLLHYNVLRDIFGGSGTKHFVQE